MLSTTRSSGARPGEPPRNPDTPDSPSDGRRHAGRRWSVVAGAALAGIAFALSCAGQAMALASHAGWPHWTHLAQHVNDESGTLRGLEGQHNLLLGGNGNDTIFAANQGDILWGDSHATTQSTSQRDYLHGGAGPDWIYASHGFNEIWTGAGNDHVALVYGYGVVHCNGPGVKKLVMRFLPSNRPWTLLGCDHKVIEPYKA
jgi:RTX calcium-binding nonapeptide repeat (4 copies)